MENCSRPLEHPLLETMRNVQGLRALSERENRTAVGHQTATFQGHGRPIQRFYGWWPHPFA
jgi:hypothetical protein